jgi:hypothetical protein
MQGADNTPELRARLRPSVARSPAETLVHKFDNRLTEYCFATQLEDEHLMEFYGLELRQMYVDALLGRAAL